MFKKIITSTALTAALLAGAATAQDKDPFTGPYIVGEVGYENGAFGFDQLIYGGAAGYNLALNDAFFVGVEGEIHGSSLNAIDFTYGFTGNLGYRVDRDLAVFARAGYREFNSNGFGSSGDYTLGLGLQYALTDNISFRPIVDTVGFDTIGVRAGLAYSF